jgi:hypothetical protein
MGPRPVISEVSLQLCSKASCWPGVVRSPAAYSPSQIWPVVGIVRAIEVGYVFRNFLTSASFTTLRLDDHDVIQILDPPVASYFAALASESLGDLDCRIADRQVVVSNPS